MDREGALWRNALLGGALERAIGSWLTRNPESRELLKALSGKVIALRAPPLIESLYLFPTPEGLQLQTEFLGTPDVALRGTPLAFMQIGLRAVPHRGDLAAGGIEFSGDIALAEPLCQLFEVSRIDWPRLFRPWVPADLVSGLSERARALRDWGTAGMRSLEQDLGEFVREEVREVPSSSEVQDFCSSVDQLRDDCARIEARIERLRHHCGGRPAGTA